MAARTTTRAKAAPKLRRASELMKLSKTADYGQRRVQRIEYHPPTSAELRGTVLDGKDAAAVRKHYEELFAGHAHQRGLVPKFRVLENGIYRVDYLEPSRGLPSLVPFAEVYEPIREELSRGLDLVIGMGESGPIKGDLAKWPHGIIGGATGGGKTIYVFTLAAQLGDKSPEHLRLAFADMGMVGLVPFSDLPHLIAPVALNIPDLIELLRQVSREMDLRGNFFASHFEIRSGGTSRTRRGINELSFWNTIMRDAGRDDLALPAIGVFVDEWKFALRDKDLRDQVINLAADLMRLGRKWEIHVALIAQLPKKGTGDSITFPDDMMEMAVTRIALARGAQAVFWRSVLGEDRDWNKDKELLVSPDGTVPPGRGMLLTDGLAQPFQGLFIDAGLDTRTYASELDKIIERQTKHWQMDRLPGARLLSERPYAVEAPSRIIVDLDKPGDEAIQVVGGTRIFAGVTLPAAGKCPHNCDRCRELEAAATTLPATPGRPALAPKAAEPKRTVWSEEDDSESDSPRPLDQEEVDEMSPLTAARVAGWSLKRFRRDPVNEGKRLVMNRDVLRATIGEYLRLDPPRDTVLAVAMQHLRAIGKDAAHPNGLLETSPDHAQRVVMREDLSWEQIHALAVAYESSGAGRDVSDDPMSDGQNMGMQAPFAGEELSPENVPLTLSDEEDRAA